MTFSREALRHCALVFSRGGPRAFRLRSWLALHGAYVAHAHGLTMLIRAPGNLYEIEITVEL